MTTRSPYPPAYPEMALQDESERARLMALRSLVHVGVVRVAVETAPRGFRLLQAGGLLKANRVGADHAHCRLNEAGLEFARKALK